MKAASTDRRDFVTTNRVVGTVGDADKARAAVDALLRAGFEQEHIDILHGEEDLRRLDLTGADHGFLAQFQRTLIRKFELDEFKHLTHHAEDLRAGRFVITVLTRKRPLRLIAADILHEHGAEFVAFYGRWAWEDLPATPHTTPEDVPALFARAWNERNAGALASLFEENAEFVNGDGVCWHDRDSIRKGHVSRFAQAVGTATMAANDTKVRLLSPEVAVVHARMALSEGDSPDGGRSSGPRTTLVSFVVHRAGDRWLCASAHHTDLAAAASVVREANGLGAANYPSNQVI